MPVLGREFYNRDTLAVAEDVMGKYLVRTLPEETLVCRIVETEAYAGPGDKACHSYGYRRTPRNSVMFGLPGCAYVYFVYGMHHCLNFVTEAEGEPCAVLIRALEPVVGGDSMALRRYGLPYNALSAYRKKNLLNGPGKLCQALDITRAQNGADLTEGPLLLRDDLPGVFLEDATARAILSGPRIGIGYAQEAKDYPYRFYYENSK
ncbi:DNA-3-methyladenine glycosylase [Papillibacter cinnamivorans]|uniref:Putative 3-methyladenine DNA glycosylase n=1 Tax=Papillibacter cinnamivorans DSM 12816 TaxID=1122930 RepID=A0A1W1ZGU4_9FIRM|nr:DNA-3-methyladenine glycosylase [Papillibacter cinnamivorans]SMC47583.1 DNA-3-methyladenine glycosylase [Papillibacter cinnamivorans DSM 12816]